MKDCMKITIHRGTHQIGGCVTEYEYNGWRLFVDYGEELQGGPKSGKLEVEGLTKGDLSKSALLITHYHGDHIGCITELASELPIYIGKTGREIQFVLSDHLKSVDGVHQEMLERLKKSLTFEAGKKFSFGPFEIMPITIDHSAFDAYAFKITVDDVKVFHTGDFRTHGFRSSKLPKVIKTFVGEVDYVVSEATNVVRPNSTSQTEQELQLDFIKSFKEHKGNIVYMSSTNIDRLFSLYHAALKAKRPFFVDSYQKKIMDVVVKRDTLWGKSRLYQYGDFEPIELQYEKNEFRINEKFKDVLERGGYVLIARVNPRFNNFIEKLPGEKTKYLSMWKGYVDPNNEAYNSNLAEVLGDKYKPMHTSGHCDMNSMREFLRLLNPMAIIPIHTDSPTDFARLFCDEWPIILLDDGDSISPISSRYADSISALVTYGKQKKRGLGFFRRTEDAKSVLSHIYIGPEEKLGYEIWEEEDLMSEKKESGLLSELQG